MSASGDERILEAAEQLASQSLFVLSTANQELFHSNMLYLLAKNYPQESLPLLRTLGFEFEPSRIRSVERERKKIDLLVATEHGSRLVIENKVTAIPSNKQLSEYGARFVTERDSFTLLSFLKFEEPLPPWKHVPYASLIDPLTRTASALAPKAPEMSMLVESYAQMIRELDSVCQAAKPARPDEPWLLGKETKSKLVEMRVWPLVSKLRAVSLNKKIVEISGRHTAIGFSNTEPFIEFFGKPVKGSSGDTRGWQLQGDEFRLCVAVGEEEDLRGKSNRAKREQYVSDNYVSHFEFRKLDSAASVIRPRVLTKKVKPWRGYSPNLVYKFETVASTASFGEVAELCISAIKRVDSQD